MTKRLDSFLDAATVFATVGGRMEIVLHRALDGVMAKIERTAAGMLGDYQPAAGGFPAWAPLSEVTLARKADAGFAVPKPLIATGDMLASFGHETRGLEGVAGATDEKMRFHESGTSKMPPRPVWGPAAFNNREAIRALIGAAVVAGVSGQADRLVEDGGFRYRIRV